MGNRPTVSVITCFLNAEDFLRETIESVLAQTCDRWELLLVNDGSTDDSGEIARSYAAARPEQVRYLEHEGGRNRGVCASRNLAFRHAGGECVALLDADDLWLPEKLERQVETLNRHPAAGMLYGACEYWHSWTGKTEDLDRDHTPELGVPINTMFQPPSLLTILYPLGKGRAPSLSDLLLRRKVIERVGGFEEDFRGIYQLYEDQAFLTKVYAQTPVFVADGCLSKYRIHPASCDSTVMKAGQHDTVRLFFLEWLAGYLSVQGIRDEEVWKALRRELWQYRHPALSRLWRGARNPVRGARSLSRLIARQSASVAAGLVGGRANEKPGN